VKYGLFGKFVAHPGKQNELVAILLKAAELLKKNSDCFQYLVSTTDIPGEVWVVEAWVNKKAHDKSLEPQNIKELIQEALPLIASMPDQQELSIHGGKGIAP
jgi:quinol monooxygenase YgiN